MLKSSFLFKHKVNCYSEHSKFEFAFQTFFFLHCHSNASSQFKHKQLDLLPKHRPQTATATVTSKKTSGTPTYLTAAES